MNGNDRLILITGPCGTGKSYLCDKLRKIIKKHHSIAPTNYLCDMVGAKTIYKYTRSKVNELHSSPFKHKVIFLEEIFLF